MKLILIFLLFLIIQPIFVFADIEHHEQRITKTQFEHETFNVVIGSYVKHIHANNGIIETKYQNGDMHYEDTKTARKWTVYATHSQGTLVQRFIKWVTDRSHYGN